jgi:hypothetical protein
MIRAGFGACAVAVGVLFSAGVYAGGMSKSEYKAGNERIAGEYKSAKDACKSLSGNANDICMKEAEAKATIANAGLKAAYQPSAKNRYKAGVSKAQAEYAVAKARCDDKAGNVKDVCVKEAQAAEVAGIADAKARMEISDANGTAVEKTVEARRNAASDKRDADYAVAREKSDVFAGDAKAGCMNDAKAAFGKS